MTTTTEQWPDMEQRPGGPSGEQPEPEVTARAAHDLT
jgi:hypothetical protein